MRRDASTSPSKELTLNSPREKESKKRPVILFPESEENSEVAAGTIIGAGDSIAEDANPLEIMDEQTPQPAGEEKVPEAPGGAPSSPPLPPKRRSAIRTFQSDIAETIQKEKL